MLLLNTSSSSGGAAIAARRILAALNKHGEPSVMLVRDGATTAEGRAKEAKEGIELCPHRRWARWLFVWERLKLLVRVKRRSDVFLVDDGSTGIDITRTKAFEACSAVHLHWVNQGFMSLASLERILASGKPVVWTLHDQWPFTGVCHVAHECTRWRNEGCRGCELLDGRVRHLAERTYARKAAVYAKARPGQLTFVGCSKWLAALARESELTKGHRVVDIPNPIDTAFFAPAENIAQPIAQLKLTPSEAPIFLLFTAFNLLDENKGYRTLIRALQLFKAQEPALAARCRLLLAGKHGAELAAMLPIACDDLGYVSDPLLMRAAYQTASVLLMPTNGDNLPNTIVEAMACGTPAIASAVGGVTQMIAEGANGFLVPPADAAAFCAALAKALKANPAPLARNARATAVARYSEEAVATAYKQLLSNQ